MSDQAPEDPRIRVLRGAIRDVPDFPKPGIVFKDLTTLLKDPVAYRHAMDLLTESCRGLGPEKVVAIESRGFVPGAVVADRLGIGFAPVRKPGKLPYRRRSRSYALEYGTDSVEIHEDAVAPGERALIVDDLIATGGTAEATGLLVRELGATVAGFAFLVELSFLNGRERLGDAEVRSVVVY
ncbi:MAG TPA: adenine phosphoribosyltransferase [Vicinamibacteria bacterium]|nr:adenine phosphoribosyltransferase [Vicinamibacteria bacterium]